MNLRLIQRSTLLMLSASSLLVACGDDGGNNPPVCGGHGSSCGPFAEDVPEGGEFRIELQKSGTDGTISAATHAYFYKDQTPAARPLMGPEFPAGSGCIDMTAGIYFDNGSGPMATQIADTRTYIDAGASVKIKHAQKEITLDKLMNEKDYSSLLTHDIVYLPASADGSDYPTNAAYSVEWTGGELGAMTMTEPTDSGTNEAIESQLFVPAPMTNINPSFASNLQFPATGDWEVTYEKAAAPAGSPFEMTFILFLNESTGGAEFQCTGDPSTGKITVPRAVLDKLQPTGLALFGTFTQIGHMQSERRLDTVGVNCTYQNYTKL